jgi:hypothetical protein
MPELTARKLPTQETVPMHQAGSSEELCKLDLAWSNPNRVFAKNMQIYLSSIDQPLHRFFYRKA